MLTREELVAFKRDGVVIVRNLIPQHQIAEWRKQCWEPLAIGPGDPLPQGGAGSRNSFLFTEDHAPRLRYPYPDLTQVADPRPLCPAVGEQPEMKAVLDQLLGPNTWAPGIAAPPDADAGIEMDVVAFRWPVDEEVRAEGVDPTSTWRGEYTAARRWLGAPTLRATEARTRAGRRQSGWSAPRSTSATLSQAVVARTSGLAAVTPCIDTSSGTRRISRTAGP